MRQKLLAGALIGLFVGLLAAFAEWLHLALFERAVGFQPLLLLYADLVDGAIGLALGLIGGGIWAFVAAARRGWAPPSTPAAVEAAPAPSEITTITWRRYAAAGPVPAPAAQRGLSRRAALRLGVAVASAGALSLGGFVWTTREGKRSSGAP